MASKKMTGDSVMHYHKVTGDDVLNYHKTPFADRAALWVCVAALLTLIVTRFI